MSLLSDIANALAPVVRQLAGDFGCTVTVYRPTTTRTAANQAVRTYSAADSTLTDVPAFFVPDTNSAAARAEGVVPVLRGTLRLPRSAAGVIAALDVFDGVKVTSGAYAGYTFLCDAESAPDPAGLGAVVTLASAPAGVIP